MPELPEVETVMRGMAPVVTGRQIAQVDQRRAGLRVPFPDRLPEILTGKTVNRLSRRAKYILAHLDGGRVLVLHLGMSGRVLLPAPGEDYTPEKHDHLILTFDNGARLVFRDPRRFGMVLLLEENTWSDHKAFAGLGPEPLGNDFSAPVLAAALAGRQTPIKTALLDQRHVAGLGNIYVCEALFQAGIDPERPAANIKPDEAEALVVAIRDVLGRAIAAGGSSLKDYRQADGHLGYFQHQFAVYGRAGEPCPGCTCDVSKTKGVRQIRQAGRSSFYCPEKQK
ncbi:MAG: bifunctional DNA-formamidopyrimidine glycosylase/DNA-(apurinic or apyrimidinic site) lyase [Rhodospirillales bacterium]|nr:bifunctional DNA-formamidopyrimidine glycosylase/DNA-(apurinic or apyrimidinic site) lyase [Rhodospirillales bacterium]